MSLQAAKAIGAGLAAIGLTGAGKQNKSVIHRFAGLGSSSMSISKGSRMLHTEAKPNFFKEVHEADIGQKTDNVFIEANRFIKSGETPNANIINLVLKLDKDNMIDDNMLKVFKDLYNNRVTFEKLPINKKEIETFRSLDKTSKPGGVYLFHNNLTGEQYVGSSKNLIQRVRDHYYGRTHGRLAQHLAKDGIQNYSVSVTVLPNHLLNITNTLALERYLIFLLNPSINFLKVANSSHKEYSEMELANIRELMGKKLFVYYKGVLVYIFDSIRECFTELGESNNFHERVLVRMKGLFRQDLLFSKTRDILAKEELITLDEFKELFFKVKEANKRVQALPNNTQAVMTTFNDTKVLHNSVSAVAKWLENETGKSCSLFFEEKIKL